MKFKQKILAASTALALMAGGWGLSHVEWASLAHAKPEDNPAAARRVALRIVETVEQQLPDNPHLGRPGRVPGTRELVIPRTPYIVPYRVHRNALEILRVYHGARRWPESL